MACTSSDTREATARWHQGEWKVTHDSCIKEALIAMAAPGRDDFGKVSSEQQQGRQGQLHSLHHKQKHQQNFLAPQQTTLPIPRRKRS
mmetsp:Transcript_17385/g.49311  ORF Transcript_17385/g.49311 Transcript_17385/m.49311 type:complete len:88 (-) Transcript_17385:1052-1315(-)